MFTASSPRLPNAWYRSAADHSRQTLFPRGLVPALAALLLLLLWVIVPTQQLQKQLGQAKQSDALTIAYMQAWIAADPGDHDMEYLLARHLYIAGRQDESAKLVERVIANASTRPDKIELLQNAQLLKLSLIEAKAFSFKEGSEGREKNLQLARNWLGAIALQTADKNLLRLYLRRSMALDDTRMSQQIAARINPHPASRLASGSGAQSAGATDDDASPESILATPEARGKDAVANGRWQEAADIYWGMYDASGNAQSRKEILLLLIRNEQWGNRLPEFFKGLDARLGSLPQDHGLIKTLAKLALAANRLDLAERFVRQLMQFSSASPAWTTWLAALNPIASAHAETAPRPASRAELLERDWDTSQNTKKTELPPMPRASFDDETFTIAYQVFLAKGYQEDAYKVAVSAVRQAPAHGEWRRRLAQIAEWTHRPDEALEHWLFLAQHPKEAATTKPLLTPELAWANVKRLSTMLNQFPVQVLVLEHDQALDPGNTAIDLAILSIEEKIGATDKAVARLQQRIAALGVPGNGELLKALLGLATRLQDVDLIMNTSRMTDKLYGPNLERAAAVAGIMAARGHQKKAYDYLLRFESVASNPAHLDQALDKRIHYWSQLAQMAHTQQDDEMAVEAYCHGLELGSLERFDLETLSGLLENTSVIHAARVMMQAYLMDHNPQTLTRAALLWIRSERLDEMNLAFSQARPEDVATTTSNRDFLKTRASYYQSKGQFTEGLADLRTALRLRPEDSELRTSLIWLLVAARQAPMLENVLRLWHDIALREPEYWGAFGAAWLSLGEPQKALPFFTKQARQNTDYLWRLSYADALESAGFADPAWLLRKNAWTELQKLPEREVRESPDVRDRVVALAMQFAPADAARQMLASLVRDNDLKALKNRRGQSPASAAAGAGGDIAAITSGPALAESMRQMMSETSPDNPPDARPVDTRPVDPEARKERAEQRSAASEMALSYMLSREGVESARAWLLTRYANTLSQPTWARLSIALATQDRAQLARLLDDLPDWLPRLERIEALKQVGRNASAQTVAFETLDSRPASQEAYNAFLSTLDDDPRKATISTLSGHFADVDYRETRIGGNWRFNQRFALSGQLADGQIDWSPAPGNLAGSMPLATHKAGLMLKTITENGTASLGVDHNQLLRGFTSLNMDWNAHFENGWSLQARAGWHSSASETPALMVAGMKNSAEARISYQMSSRDTFSVMTSASRYATQGATLLGSGFTFLTEYAHKLDSVLPTLSVNVVASRSMFKHGDGNDALTALVTPAGYAQASSYFLPASYNQVDVFLSSSETLSTQGRGPLRPFGQFGLRYNSLIGAGYNLRAGMAGSLIGRDSLMVYLQSASATPGSTRGSSELGLKYNYFF